MVCDNFTWIIRCATTLVGYVSLLYTSARKEKNNTMKVWLMFPLFIASVSALSNEQKTLIVQDDTRGGQLVAETQVSKDRQTSDSLENSNGSVGINDNVCLTKGCVKIAAFLISNMNESQDPCNDFYNFACGRYIERTIIPDEESSISVFAEMDKSLLERIRLVLEQGETINDSNTTTKLKKLYETCMDTKFIEEDGLQPLRNIVKRLGGWPVVEGSLWNESSFSLMETLYSIGEIGYTTPLISLSVEPNLENSSWRTIMLDQTSLGLEREYLLKGINDSDVKTYLEYASSVAKLAGASSATAEKEMTEMVSFEIQLANITSSRAERRNFSRLLNFLEINALMDMIPEVPWFEFIRKQMPNFVQVDLTENVMVLEEKYFKNLVQLLNKTRERTIANYLLWNVVQESIPFLSDDIRELRFKLAKKLHGTKTKVPRWKKCTNVVRDSMSIGVGNLYVKNFFNEESKNKIMSMVRYLRNTFDQMLQSVDWMDETTKRKALEKSRAIQTHVAYPKELLMENMIEDYHKNITIKENSFLENMLQMSVVTTDYSRGLLRDEVDKSDWKAQAAVADANAYYYSLENSIKFPAGILQEAMFDSENPSYINFGGIGYAIGHEITHGFDSQGRQFDAEGNFKNWWDPKTANKFLIKAKCIIDQYSSYIVPENGLRLNGVNSQGEDVADNGGTKEAYLAYQQWVKDNGPEPSLPGLSFNANQLFWISLGQKLCSKSRPEALKKQIMTGNHTPSRFRMIGPIQNSHDFANDFNCPMGSPMNPANKCTVW